MNYQLLLVFLFIVALTFFVVKEGFWPSEDVRVPSQAWHSNKFNNVLGNESSGIVGPGAEQVVVASDWYTPGPLPTEFDGPYWPQGSIRPDYSYPGNGRPLRRPDLPSSVYYKKVGDSYQLSLLPERV